MQAAPGIIGTGKCRRRLVGVCIAFALIVAAGGTLVAAMCGRFGLSALATAKEAVSSLATGDTKAHLLVEAAAARYVLNDRRRSVELCRKAWTAAHGGDARLLAARSLVHHIEEADGSQAAVKAYEQVFTEWAGARADAALRARYISALTRSGRYNEALREFRQFTTVAAFAQSRHAGGAVVAGSAAALRAGGPKERRGLLRSVIREWPGTPMARRAEQLLHTVDAPLPETNSDRLSRSETECRSPRVLRSHDAMESDA